MKHRHNELTEKVRAALMLSTGHADLTHARVFEALEQAGVFDLQSVLWDAKQDLRDWADDNEEPGEPFLETEAIIEAANAAFAKGR